MSDQYAAGMRRAAEMCDQLIEASPKSRGVGYWRVVKSMILAAIPAPWEPPPEAERPDGYRCLGVVGVETLRVQRNPYTHWNTANDTYHGWFTVRGSEKCYPTAFAPLPPAPEESHE